MIGSSTEKSYALFGKERGRVMWVICSVSQYSLSHVYWRVACPEYRIPELDSKITER